MDCPKNVYFYGFFVLPEHHVCFANSFCCERSSIMFFCLKCLILCLFCFDEAPNNHRNIVFYDLYLSKTKISFFNPKNKKYIRIVEKYFQKNNATFSLSFSVSSCNFADISHKSNLNFFLILYKNFQQIIHESIQPPILHFYINSTMSKYQSINLTKSQI